MIEQFAKSDFPSPFLARLPPIPYDYRGLLATLNRCKLWLVFWILLCATVGLVYILLTPPEYTASTQIVLETPKKQRLSLDVDGDPVPIDSAQADSRLQVIKSERLLRFVFDTLKLESPTKSKSPAATEVLPTSVSGPLQSKSESEHTRALLEFMDRVSARRVGLSYAIEILYRDKSPVQAARIANSITDAYIRDLVLAGPNDSEVLQRSISDVARDAQLLLDGLKAGYIPPEAFKGVDARVIGSAIVPLSKSAPHTTLTLAFAFVIGLTTGLAALLVVHSRDRVIRNERSAAKLFGSRLLATLNPQASEERSEVSLSNADQERLGSALAACSSGFVRVGVVSWHSTNATSSLSKELADTFSEGAPTTVLRIAAGLVANTDMPLGVPEEREAGAPQTLRRGRRTAVPSPNPQILHVGLTRDGRGWLNSEAKRAAVFAKLQKQGHLVLDLPPLVDSRVFSSLGGAMEGAVLVVEQGRSTIDEVSAAIGALEFSHLNLVGVVLSATPRTKARSFLSIGMAWRRVSKVLRPTMRITYEVVAPFDLERRG